MKKIKMTKTQNTKQILNLMNLDIPELFENWKLKIENYEHSELSW